MKIGFVTGSRSEWGYIRPILRQIEAAPDLDYALLVTNMHLLSEFGSSVREIERDGFRVDARLPVPLDGVSGLTATQSLASLLAALPAALARTAPDLLLLAGDRGEQLMAAIAAVHMRIPVAHVQCGELSGHVDGIVRHAITKLAHLHFAANEESAERVRRLGEELFRVHVTGAPLTDELEEGRFEPPERLAASLGVDLARPLVLAVQHPVAEEEPEAGRQIEETLAALLEIGLPAILVAPNGDAGSRAIRARLAALGDGPIRVFANLPRAQYLGLLKLAAVLVGNSSSGILEAPSFGTPCVNIGRRQRGRQQAGNVLDVDHCRHAIAAAIRRALAPEFADRARRAVNPYGRGGAARRIVEVLRATPIGDRLLNKELTF